VADWNVLVKEQPYGSALLLTFPETAIPENGVFRELLAKKFHKTTHLEWEVPAFGIYDMNR
jgi:hypothetical protein